MRRFEMFGAVLLTVLCAGSVAVVGAAVPGSSSGPGVETYITVVEGDSLWTLDHDFNLAALAAKNPQLKPSLDDPSRLSDWHGIHNGRVTIIPGEHIVGVTRHGKNLVPEDVKSPMTAGTETGPVPPIPATNANPSVQEAAQSSIGWLIVLLFLSTMIALWKWRSAKQNGEKLLADERERSQTLLEGERIMNERTIEKVRQAAQRQVADVSTLYNPYTARAVAPGGLPPSAPDAIEQSLLRESYRELPVAPHIPYDTAIATRLYYRIGPIEYGLMNGHVRVRGAVQGSDPADLRLTYAPKILVNQPGYRTTVHLPNGSEMVVYSLAGCCNPVRVGNWIEGAGNDFTFTLMAGGATVAPAPAPPTPVVLEPVEDQVAEFTTPTGGRLVVYGPGLVSSAVGDVSSLTVTVAVPAEPASDDVEFVDVPNEIEQSRTA